MGTQYKTFFFVSAPDIIYLINSYFFLKTLRINNKSLIVFGCQAEYGDI